VSNSEIVRNVALDDLVFRNYVAVQLVVIRRRTKLTVTAMLKRLGSQSAALSDPFNTFARQCRDRRRQKRCAGHGERHIEDQADPDGVLTQADRARAARHQLCYLRRARERPPRKRNSARRK
jgi:hypothetical protein